MSRSGLRRLMTTKQMEIYTSYLAKYQQVSTLGTIHKNTISLFIRTVCKSDSLLFFTIYYIINLQGKRTCSLAPNLWTTKSYSTKCDRCRASGFWSHYITNLLFFVTHYCVTRILHYFTKICLFHGYGFYIRLLLLTLSEKRIWF